MAKNPYIQFYIGDYIKDTRILPLNVRGAWVDLILFMWDNQHKGEISGTMEEFSRLMCCSVDEAILVIQTLKQKNIFSWEELPNGVLKIISRKQKKMAKLSQKRSESGKNGGNPALLQAKDKNLLKQKVKLNTENENEYENENSKEGVIGEGIIYDIGNYLKIHPIEFEALQMDAGRHGLSPPEFEDLLCKFHLWNIEHQQYPKPPLALIAGLGRWIINEKKKPNGYSASNSNGSAKLGTSEGRTKKAREWGSDFIPKGT
jgi:hypothetical protein